MSITQSSNPPAPLEAPSPLSALRALPATVLATLGGICLAIGALYWPTIVALVEVWNKDPDYSHGFFVIPLSIFFCYLAWQRWQASPARVAVDAPQAGRGVVTAGAETVLGLMLHWVALLFGVLLLDVLSLICVIRAALKITAGAEVNRLFAFPALFLIFMAPLPMLAQQALALFMQQTVAMVATAMLEVLQVPAIREGYMIYLPGAQPMEVGEACSGLRSMTAILALGCAIGFIVNGSRWYSWTVALLAIPMAMFANVLRVVLSGGILMTIGAKYAEGTHHMMQGLVLEGIAAAMLVLAAVGLRKLDKTNN
jgi:exosortase